MRRPWGRLGLLLAILLSMVVVNAISERLFVVLISLSLIILPIINWLVFRLYLKAFRRAPDIESLGEKMENTLTQASGSTVAAIVAGVALGRILQLITVPVGSVITVGLGFVLVTLSLPAIVSMKYVIDLIRGDDFE